MWATIYAVIHTFKEIRVRRKRGVIMATMSKKNSIIHGIMASWELWKKLSHTDLFYNPFVNSSNYKAAQVLWVYTHQHKFSWNSLKTLWAFFGGSKWLRRGISNLNNESIIGQVASEKMREWRWKWVAVNTVTAPKSHTKCSRWAVHTIKIHSVKC